MSYLIDEKGCLVAKTDLTLKSGSTVRASTQVIKERINAEREYNLYGGRSYRISNAKKYDIEYAKSEDPIIAKPINGGDSEFKLI